jgi:hypothetical protein
MLGFRLMPAPEARIDDASATTAPPRGRLRRALRSRTASLLYFALAVRILTLFLAFWANVVIPVHQIERFAVFGFPNRFWDTTARYDSGWYYNIARFGYRYAEGEANNLAFFPGYPMAMRAFAGLLGGSRGAYFLGGTLVSWLAFFLAVVWLYRLARHELGDERLAFRATTLFVTFPFAFFFGVAYSEALFVAAMIGAFYAARRGRWWLAGVAAAVAVLTRVNGIFAWPAFAWLAWSGVRSGTASLAGVRSGTVSEPGGQVSDRFTRLRGPGTGAALLRVLPLVMLPLLAFAAWCAFVYTVSGSPFEWKASIERWNYHLGGGPWRAYQVMLKGLLFRPYYWFTTNPLAPYDSLNALAATTFLVGVPFVWRRFGAACGLYMLLNLVLPLSSGVFEGLGRYCAVLFPMFLLMATWPAGVQRVLSFAFPAFYFLAMASFVTLRPIF